MERSIIDLVKEEADIVGKYNTLLKEMNMYEALCKEAEKDQKSSNKGDVIYWHGEIAQKQQEINFTKKLLRKTRKYLSDILKGYEPEQ